ncbi:hypothetical protein A6A29_21575 [Streptomyces sp. TSRI0281]|nr:hypothetical protein A6A29_21575 [Streptomyces sp. TSRI0281]
MTADLRFGWELMGSGWARCRMTDGTSERTDLVSYCTDALADLLYSFAALYGPGTVHRFSFDLEPAEVRWVLRGEGSDVDIAIYLFPDMSASFDASDDDGTLVWNSRLERGALSHSIVETAQSVLRFHGEEGYRAKWMQHPFPIAALQDLRRMHVRDDVCDTQHDMSLP